jgi:hypothetical protein
MPREYVVKPTSASPYRIDGRVTVHVPLNPQAYDVHGGPHLIAVSGVRVDVDKWPSSSGT